MIDDELKAILACPACKGDLLFEETRIICPKCRKAYPIRDDIPVMLISEADDWTPPAGRAALSPQAATAEGRPTGGPDQLPAGQGASGRIVSLQAVILAGGMGTRLRPLTLNRPKPVVPLLNVPFLHHQLALLGAHGVRDVILSVSHMPEAIRSVMGRERLGASGSATSSSGTRSGRRAACGTRPTWWRAASSSSTGTFSPTSTSAPCSGAHEARRAQATIFLTPVENPTAYGLVELEPDGRVHRFLEKPGWDEVTTNTINAGIYVLERELLELIPKDQPYSMEREFFPPLLERRVPVLGHVPPGYWLDIGTPAKYLQAHQDLLDRLVRRPRRGGASRRAWVDPRAATIAPTARLRGPVVIGPGARRAGRRGGPGRGPRRRLPARARGPGRVRRPVGGRRGRRRRASHGCLVGRSRDRRPRRRWPAAASSATARLADYSRLARAQT